MSWGIAETAPEIEKIKAESADYLGGLNSCGEIEWEIYSQAFDFYADLIQKAYELGKTEAEPHWIPCSERLPKEEGFYLVTLEHEYGAETSIRFFKFENNKRYWSKWGNENITAWRQKPEPYKGVTE